MWQLSDDELRQEHAAAKVAARKVRSLPRTPANVDIAERYLRLSAKLKERGLTPLDADDDQ